MDQTIYISGLEPKLELSYNDVWLPGLYSRRILCFELPPTSSHERVLHVLKRALQSLIDGTPELGSIVELVPAERDGQLPWKALRPGNGIELIVKDLLASFPSFEELEAKNFLLPEFKDKVLMPVAVEIQAEPNPQTRVQLNLIEGGVLLSFCECHALADGNGMNTIMAALAKECKRGDHGGRLEIDGHRAVLATQGFGKQRRRESRRHAVEPGHPGTRRDQGEHVEVARPDGSPATLEEGPAGP